MEKLKISTIWLTGLSASGKSTLTTRLLDDLNRLGIKNVTLLDGEAVREKFSNNDFDSKSREEIGRKKIELAIEENLNGNIALISGIAHKRAWREEAREKIENYFEVYLDADVNVCAKRDYKDQYRKALSGELENFVGVTEFYEKSTTVDLVLNTGTNSIESCADQLLKNVLKFIGYNK